MGLASDVAHQATETVAQEPEFAVVALELVLPMRFLPSSHLRLTGFRCAAECSCRHHRRIPVILLFHQRCPDSPRHLVGQGDLARAIATSMRGFLAIMRAGQEPLGTPFREAHCTTAMAPRMSNRRASRWPIFELFPNRCLPPVDFCSSPSPSTATVTFVVVLPPLPSETV